MDPITEAVVAAVAAGLDEEEKALLVEAGKKDALQAYDTLKKRIKDRYTTESELLEAILLLEGEDTPENRQRVADEVEKVQAADHPRLVEAAHVLLAELGQLQA